MHITTSYTFHYYMIAAHISLRISQVSVLKVTQAGVIFTSTYHTKYLNPWPNSPASRVSIYSWLVACSLEMEPLKDHPALVDVWQDPETNLSKSRGCHLAAFSEDLAFACHFMAIRLPPTLPPYRSASSIDYPVKNYLKWWAIQIAIHSIADA